MDEYKLQAFSKLLSEVEEARDVATYGTLQHYDRAIDRVSVKLERALRTCESVLPNVTVSDDPVLKAVLETGTMPDGTAAPEGDLVFISAQLMAGLMTAPRSVNSWDIVVTHKLAEGNRHVVLFDKREGSGWDYLPVGETSAEPPVDIPTDKDHVNAPAALAVEAAEINRNFLAQVLKPATKYPYGKTSTANPFDELIGGSGADTPVVPVGYRYRMWDMRAIAADENARPISLIARTEVNTVTPAAGAADKVNIVAVHALNECFPADPTTGALLSSYAEWRSKLDGQRGAVMANEMRNNAWK